MKALLRTGHLSGYIDIKEPYEKLYMELPYSQIAYQYSVDWNNKDSIVFKLAHISELDGEKIAVYNFYEPKLILRQDERIILLEEENRRLQKEKNDLQSKINGLLVKYEPTNDEDWN